MRTIHNFTLQRKARFMLSNKSRNSCLALSLSLALVISSTNTKAGIRPQSKIARIGLATTAIAIFASYVRLHSKGTAKFMDYKWEEDWKDLLKVYNITTSEYWALVDKYWIGRYLSILDYKYTDEKNGKQRTIKDKFVKSAPFGVMGLIDAYVLIQIAKLIKLSGDAGTAFNAIYNYVELNEKLKTK